MINRSFLEEKSNRHELMKRIILGQDDTVPSSDKTWFDKEVDTDLLRKTFFSDGNQFLANALPIKFKTTQLINNDEIAKGLRATSAIGFKYHNNMDIHSYHKIVHFSSEFFLEISGYNCVGRDSDNKPKELDSFLVIHLVDPETQKKLFIGNVIIHISEQSKMRDCTIRLERTLWELMSDSFKVRKGIHIVIGDTFTNLDASLLKPYAGVKVTILTYRLNHPKGTKSYLTDFTKDALAISKHAPDVLQVYDYRSAMFAKV